MREVVKILLDNGADPNIQARVSVNTSERGVYGSSEVQQRSHTGHGCDVWFCAEFS